MDLVAGGTTSTNGIGAPKTVWRLLRAPREAQHTSVRPEGRHKVLAHRRVGGREGAASCAEHPVESYPPRRTRPETNLERPEVRFPGCWPEITAQGSHLGDIPAFRRRGRLRSRFSKYRRDPPHRAGTSKTGIAANNGAKTTEYGPNPSPERHFQPKTRLDGLRTGSGRPPITGILQRATTRHNQRPWAIADTQTLGRLPDPSCATTTRRLRGRVPGMKTSSCATPAGTTTHPQRPRRERMGERHKALPKRRQHRAHLMVASSSGPAPRRHPRRPFCR